MTTSRGAPHLLDQNAAKGSSADRVSETSFNDAEAGSSVGPRQAWMEPGQTLYSGRFCIEQVLGAGGMGVVYRAMDHELGGPVALKVLQASRGPSVGLLKNEFRSLRSLVHPSLVLLHELFCDEDLWFFSMELVDGEAFDIWVRAAGRTEQELANGLVQLAAGLSAIHQAGWIHRDIKPSNVLVDAAGRVVILDFGLAQLSGEADAPLPRAGTRAFMAPEQVEGRSLTEAVDWYAVGATLYWASTGLVPRLRCPSTLVDEMDKLPPGCAQGRERLRRLCSDLLQISRQERASAQEVYSYASEVGVHARPGAIQTEHGEFPFVGRDRQLQILRSSWESIIRERPYEHVFVYGSSGIGKTALLSEFVREVETAGGLVLQGRCYERENIPFKGLDSVVEAVVSELNSWSLGDRANVLTGSSGWLERMFPALRALLAPEAANNALPEDLEGDRARAFAALRQVFCDLTRERPCLLWIDDLHWGDTDTARLLLELLTSDERPRMLLVATFRTEERALSPCLQILERGLGANAKREVVLGALEPGEAQLLAETAVEDRLDATHIVAQSRAEPFLLTESLLHFKGREGARNHGTFDVARALSARVEALSPRETRLLEAVALCSEPVQVTVVARAAGMPAVEQRALVNLERMRLLRSRFAKKLQWVEPYHDKIREALLSQMSPVTKKRHHEALLDAMAHAQIVDPGLLAPHYLGTGQKALARSCALRAASAAEEALAFGSAAAWYRLALSLPPPSGEAPSLPDLKVRLARALALVGNAREAATSYLDLARDAEALDALEYTRLAAYSLVAGGYEEDGFSALSEVLAQAKLPDPANERFPLVKYLFERTRVWARGLDFQQRSESEVSRDLLLRIDAANVVALGMMTVHPLRGARFGAIEFRYALDAGEPTRLVRAIGTELLYTTMGGERARRRAKRLAKMAETVLESTPAPSLRAYFGANRSVSTALLHCDFVAMARDAEPAELVMREHFASSWWDINRLRGVWALSLIACGRFKELTRRLDSWLAEAQARSDHDLQTTLGTYPSYSLIAEGRLEDARNLVATVSSKWRRDPAEHSRFSMMYALAAAECYERASAQRLDDLATRIDGIHKKEISRVPFLRIFAMQWANCCDLSVCSIVEDDRRWVKRARARARRLRREGLPWAAGLVFQVEAVVCLRRGKRHDALRALERATHLFEESGMLMLAAATRYRWGELLRGESGAEQIKRAVEYMHQEGVTEPARYVNVYAPGYEFGAHVRQGRCHGMSSQR